MKYFNWPFLVGLICLIIFNVTATTCNFWDPNCIPTNGQIGDTIGGLSQPIIGLLSIYLLYKSFKIQYEANVAQDERHKREKQNQLLNRNYEMIFAMFTECKGDLSELSYSDYNGKRAMNYFLNKIVNEDDRGRRLGLYVKPIFKQLSFLSTQFHQALLMIDEVNLRENERKTLILLLTSFYNQNLRHYCINLKKFLRKDDYYETRQVIIDSIIDQIKGYSEEFRLKKI